MSGDGAFALVTGASSGIGAAFGRALAARGRRVILVARRDERLRALSGELGGEARAVPIAMDLAEPGAPRRLRERVAGRGFEIELLVNNAGLGHTGPYAEEPPETAVRVVDLNARVVAELTREVLPGMLARRRGGIINVCSMSSFQPVPFLATYAASKAFALSFTEALAVELRGSGVEVQALCPGLVKTEFQALAGTDQVPFDKSPSQTAEFVVEASLRALGSGRVVVIPGARDRLVVFLQRFLPRSLVLRAGAELFRPIPSKAR